MIRILVFLVCFGALFIASTVQDGAIRNADAAIARFCEHSRPTDPMDRALAPPEKIRLCRSLFEVEEGANEWYVQPKPEYRRKNSAGWYLGYTIYGVSKDGGLVVVSSVVN